MIGQLAVRYTVNEEKRANLRKIFGLTKTRLAGKLRRYRRESRFPIISLATSAEIRKTADFVESGCYGGKRGRESLWKDCRSPVKSIQTRCSHFRRRSSLSSWLHQVKSFASILRPNEGSLHAWTGLNVKWTFDRKPCQSGRWFKKKKSSGQRRRMVLRIARRKFLKKTRADRILSYILSVEKIFEHKLSEISIAVTRLSLTTGLRIFMSNHVFRNPTKEREPW